MTTNARALLAWCAIPALGCAADVEPSPANRDEPVAATQVIRSSVVGGREVSTCAWPSTVRVSGASQCTGTLIHPRVVTTAAHCLNGTSARVTFGGPRDASAFSVMARCRSGARGSTGVSGGSDWGYCILPEDPRIAALPVTPPLVGCEAARFLKPGARAWVVGYGVTGPRGQGGGIKREVEVAINRVDRARGVIDVGDAMVGACHGDSGGPLYVHLVDERGVDLGYRVAGSTSGPGARNCDCTCSTAYVDIAKHVAEIERAEAIDVTPCTDANGAWSGGPLCGALPSARMQASGTFPACSVPRTTAAIATCEAQGNELDGGATPAADAGEGGAGAPTDGGVVASDASEAPDAHVDAAAPPAEEDESDEDEAGGGDEAPEGDGEPEDDDAKESDESDHDEDRDEDRTTEERSYAQKSGACSVDARGALGVELYTWLMLLGVMRRRRPDA